jgi:hypothetical protein
MMGWAKLTHAKQRFLLFLLDRMGMPSKGSRNSHYKMACLNGLLEIDNEPFTSERFADVCRPYTQKAMLSGQQASAFIYTLAKKGFLIEVEKATWRKQHIITSKMYNLIEVVKNDYRQEEETSDSDD